MSTASQYYDSLSDDDSQDNNFSDYTTKTKSSRKRAATIKKKISRVKVPKTKRPGRKPIEKAMEEELKGDPKSKRKAQNRAAQRAFRERKEKFVEELQKRIQELEEEKNSRVTDLEVENAALKKELQKLREKTNRPTTTFTTDYTLNNNNQQQSTPLSLNDEDEEIIEDDVPHGYKCNIDSIQSLNSPPLSTGATTLSHHDDDDDLSIASFSDHLLSDYSENDNLSEISIDNNSPASEHEIPPFDTFETNPIIQDENTMNENNNINNSNNNNNNNDLFTSSIINNGYYDSLISVPNNNNNNNELTNQNQESFSSANNNTNDLFHGKTDFTFTNYRNPVSSDDWLYQNENAIPPLFGLDADRYGLSQSQLNTETPYDEQPFYNTHNIYTTTNNNNININNNSNNIHSHNHNHNHNHNNSSMFLNNINHPSINNNSNSNNKNSHDCNNDKGYYRDPDLTPCKAKLLEAIHQAKKEGKTCGEVKQVVEKVCPDYNIDSLCDELRKKAVCFDNQSTFDDKDFEILKTCIKKH